MGVGLVPSALATESLAREKPRRAPSRAAAWLDQHALFLAVLAGAAVLSLILVPADLNQDGWLALVAGRDIAAHGIPQHDTLAIMSHGARWVDQQWLAQLVIYELYRVGGLALYSIVYVALSVAGLAMALAAARELGGSERHRLGALSLAGLLYFFASIQIRTQGFAYPLFAGTLWLLARAGRSESRRVYLVFPLLIVWANLHGSVTVGVALATIYGATLLLEDIIDARRRTSWPHIRLRTVAFLVGPVLCLLVTPYGLAIATYYRHTLLNPAFSQLVSEWRPVTSTPLVAVPFFALLAGVIWVFGRSARRTPLLHHLALLVLALASVLALRSVVWFALGVIVLAPAAMGTASRPRPSSKRRTGLNLSLAGASLAVVLATLAVTAAKPISWFTRDYDLRAAREVASIVKSHPGAEVYAAERFGDWLLWEEPTLAGHIAYDVRFELLTDRQLRAIAAVGHEPSVLAPYGLLVLYPTGSHTTRTLLGRPGTHVILRSDRVVVAATPAL